MKNGNIYLTRLVDTGEQTVGILSIWEEGLIHSYHTLELPWKDNQHDISCIPPGVYDWVKWESPTKGDVIKVIEVPKRTSILIHVANYVRELRGCIAPGMQVKDIDADGKLDVVSSRVALSRIWNHLPFSGKLYINYANDKASV